MCAKRKLMEHDPKAGGTAEDFTVGSIGDIRH